jgi:hypothetical protein
MKCSEIENIWNAEVAALSNADRGRLFAPVTRARRQAVLVGTPGQFERVIATTAHLTTAESPSTSKSNSASRQS